MKQRIISGAVMAVIAAAVLFAGESYPVVVTCFLAAICTVAVYEMLYRTGAVKNLSAVISACVYSVLVQFAYSGYLPEIDFEPIYVSYRDYTPVSTAMVLTVLYALVIVVFTLTRHKSFGMREIAVLLSMPVALAYAFNSIESVFLYGKSGFFGILLLLNFSCVCDCGAYFIGRAFGKHKLAPVISPKKTIEGSVGGVLSSLIGTLVIVLGFHAADLHTGDSLAVLMLVTPLFCVLGMMGDLFASAIKRSCGIKDYGSLIPGHGGVLDRMDSILLIAPVFEICIKAGIL